MRVALPLLVVLWPAVARADEGLRKESGWLDFDPLPPTSLEAMGAEEHTEGTRVDLFPGAVLDVTGTEWSNQDDHRYTPLDLPGRGWRAEARIHIALGGGLVLSGHGTVAQSDTHFARGRHVDLALALTKVHRFSRWMTGWISLGVGARQWIGTPPAGEVDSQSVTLSVGTTFK